jgi:hypothetical protein
MRTLLRVVGWITAVALVAAGGWFGRLVRFQEQWPMFEALRTTAAIIFAVIGAWMAIIYPERLKLSLRIGKPGKGDATGLSKLFTPVVNSTAILCVILVLGATAPILKHVPLPIAVFGMNVTVTWFRGASYAILVALTLWQLWTVILSLIPASTVKSFVDHEDARRKVLDGMTKLTRPEPSDAKRG